MMLSLIKRLKLEKNLEEFKAGTVNSSRNINQSNIVLPTFQNSVSCVSFHSIRRVEAKRGVFFSAQRLLRCGRRQGRPLSRARSFARDTRRTYIHIMHSRERGGVVPTIGDNCPLSKERVRLRACVQLKVGVTSD